MRPRGKLRSRPTTIYVSILLCGALIAFAVGAVAKRMWDPQPSVSIEATQLDLGAIQAGSSVRELSIPVANAGGGSLKLAVLGSSCGCLKASAPDEGIPAGASRDIILRVDPSGEKNGPKMQNLLLSTNDPHVPHLALSVKWTVESGRDVSWIPESIHRPVSLRSYQRGNVFPGRDLVCLVFDFWQKDLKITDMKCTEGCIEPRLETIAYGCSDATKGRAFRLTTSLKEGLKPGKHIESLTLRTNHPKYQEIVIPITIAILPDIHILPSVVFIEKGNGMITRQIHVGPLRKEQFARAIKEWPDYQFVTANWEPAGMSSYSLTLHLDTDSPELPNHFALPMFQGASGPEVYVQVDTLPAKGSQAVGDLHASERN